MNYPSYIEMPFKEAIKSFPALFKMLPKDLVFHLLSDDRYLVRVDRNQNIEFGFASDNWFIN